MHTHTRCTHGLDPPRVPREKEDFFQGQHLEVRGANWFPPLLAQRPQCYTERERRRLRRAGEFRLSDGRPNGHRHSSLTFPLAFGAGLANVLLSLGRRLRGRPRLGGSRKKIAHTVYKPPLSSRLDDDRDFVMLLCVCCDVGRSDHIFKCGIFVCIETSKHASHSLARSLCA